MNSPLLDRIHRKCGKSKLIVYLAKKIRNQAVAVIRMSVQDGIDLESNGEGALISAIGPNSKLVIDVGANVGAWITHFLETAPKDCIAIVFEPIPFTANILRAKVFENKLTQIKIKEVAVSDAEGYLKIYAEDNAGECSSFVRDHARSGKELMVPVTTIDVEWEAVGKPFVDFVKIDAEGYDLHVLRGAKELIRNQMVGVIQFEYNAPWARAGSTLFEALEILRNSGYVTKLIKSEGLVDFDYESIGEIFSYCNFVAALPRYYESQLKSLLV